MALDDSPNDSFFKTLNFLKTLKNKVMDSKLSERANVIATRFSADFDGADPLAKEVAARLVQVVALFEQEGRTLFEEHDINRGLFSTLVCLRLAGEPYELRHRDLIDRILLTSGGVTNLCRRLETMQLITRHAEPEDKRSVVFRLTPSGISLANKLLPQQHKFERHLVEPLSDDEKQTLCDLLKKLTYQFSP